MSARILTKKERATLDAAEQILVGLLESKEEVVMLSLHGGWKGFTLTYFTPEKVQHGGIWTGEGCSFSSKVQKALDLRFAEEGRSEERRAWRIERLKADLARLTGEEA